MGATKLNCKFQLIDIDMAVKTPTFLTSTFFWSLFLVPSVITPMATHLVCRKVHIWVPSEDSTSRSHFSLFIPKQDILISCNLTFSQCWSRNQRMTSIAVTIVWMLATCPHLLPCHSCHFLKLVGCELCFGWHHGKEGESETTRPQTLRSILC